jgi:hypothetical protein
MVHNQFTEKDFPVTDDGWWASVLAEEESRCIQDMASSKKTEEIAKPSSDWDVSIRTRWDCITDGHRI